MRILMLSDLYPPTLGGAGEHVRALSHALAGRGHRVAVVTLQQDGLQDFEVDGDVPVYRIRGTMHRTRWLFSDRRRTYAPPFPDPELCSALRWILVRERPEIVHSHSWLGRSFHPLKAWSGARHIVTLHDFGRICAKKSLVHRQAPCEGSEVIKCLSCAAGHYGPVVGIPTTLGNWIAGAVDRATVDLFLPVSQAVAAGSGLLGGRLPFRVIPNFVPDDLTTCRDDQGRFLAQLPRRPYLLFVGLLSRAKGIHVLLRAYRDIADAPPLVLIGAVSPETPEELPSNATVLESWPREGIMVAWRRSLMGLVPSVCHDACPTVAIEAMASGQPVIGSQIGGLPELIVDGETGLLVPPNNPAALRAAIERLLRDPALAERMGQAGKRRACRFLASRIVPRIECAYRDVLTAAMDGAS